jgi:branched-chain amino acid transport system permease protein
MIMMAVVGGLSTLMGPIVGAAVIFAMQQLFQDYAPLSTLITGGALVLIVVLTPAGLWGALRGGAQRLAQAAPSRRPPLRGGSAPPTALG